MPLIVTPYLSRVLGPTELGKYSYAFSVAYYFVIFATLGITTHGSRQIAVGRDDTERRNAVFSDLFWLHMISAVGVTLIYIIFTVFLVRENKIISYILIFYVASTIFDVKWLFYGLENFKITVARNLIIKVLTIICIFVFVKTRNDIHNYTFVMAFISYFVAEASLFLLFPKYVKLYKPNWDGIKKEISPLSIMFIPFVASSVSRYIDKVMLGTMSTYKEVGFYENADKIYIMLVLVITALGDVMLPRLSNLVSNGGEEKANKLFEYALNICIISSCAFAFGISAIAKEFVPIFFGDEFLECISLLIWISPTIIMLAFSATVRKQYLMPRYKNSIFVVSMLVGTIVHIIANLYFIPKYFALGSVYSTLIAEFVILFIQSIVTMKEINYLPYIKILVVFSVIGLIMYIFIRAIAVLMPCTVLTLVVEIILGALIYSVLSLIYLKISNNELYAYGVKIKKRLLR
jgi:O-antigen/teichoic acid export membrane protein